MLVMIAFCNGVKRKNCNSIKVIDDSCYLLYQKQYLTSWKFYVDVFISIIFLNKQHFPGFDFGQGSSGFWLNFMEICEI